MPVFYIYIYIYLSNKVFSTLFKKKNYQLKRTKKEKEKSLTLI